MSRRHGKFVVLDFHIAGNNLPLLKMIAALWRSNQFYFIVHLCRSRVSRCSAVSIIFHRHVVCIRFPLRCKGHGISGSIRFKIPFSIFAFVIVIPALKRMLLFGWLGNRSYKWCSLLLPIHLLPAAIISIVRVKGDDKLTAQGLRLAEIAA